MVWSSPGFAESSLKINLYLITHSLSAVKTKQWRTFCSNIETKYSPFLMLMLPGPERVYVKEVNMEKSIPYTCSTTPSNIHKQM